MQNLTAHGGGDCPDMALTGIIKGNPTTISSENLVNTKVKV